MYPQQTLAVQQIDNAKVLIVDDELINRELLSSMLSEQARIFTACDGNQAIGFCLQHQPDLVIMDVEMPNMNGWEAAKILKKLPETRDIPIIFATALESVEDEKRCWESGGNDFMNKPLNRVTVENRVRQQLTLKFQSDFLKQLAFMDGLTQQFNRRYLDEFLPREFKLSKRNGSHLSLLMIDIDFFKKYNDTYGHLKGDSCLKSIAQRLEQCMHRPTDCVVRFGGEEFLCVLPNTAHHGAIEISNQIQQEIGKLQLPHLSSPLGHISVSIGVATSSGREDRYVELIDRADGNLYNAKQAGRNCWAA